MNRSSVKTNRPTIILSTYSALVTLPGVTKTFLILKLKSKAGSVPNNSFIAMLLTSIAEA